MKRKKLHYGDHILCAYAEPAAGPGWANFPLWLVVRSADGATRIECLQPDEQTADIGTLYRISTEINKAMTAAARMAVLIPERVGTLPTPPEAQP